MLLRINNIMAREDFSFSVEFDNGESGIFDLKPYLNIGKFKELKLNSNYKRFRIEDGVITWFNDLDIAPDTVYLDSIKQIIQ